MRLKKLLINPKSQWLYPIVILATGLLAYSAVLIVGIPSRINPILMANDSTALFIAIAIIFYLAYRPSGWIGSLTSFSATLILFASQLSGLWRSGSGQSAYVMAGLLPMTDTDAYYTNALYLLEGGTFTDMASWRPLSHGVLATLLGLTQQNFQVTLALSALITAIASFLLAREVQRSHGIAAGVLLLSTIFLFSRKYIGTASTENLGLALGAIGLAFLWRGAVNKRINPCLVGIFLMTLALNVRAGAFFILPALLVWGSWLFRGSSYFSVRFLIGGVSVALLGFILNSLVFKVVTAPDTVPYSNFSYSLYGLIVGSNWEKVYLELRPELKSLSSDLERSQKMSGLIWQALRANPFSLVTGCVRAWTMFIGDDFVFSFVQSAKVNVTLQILSLIALFNCYRQRQTALASLMIAATVGILLSVPFVPPWDAGTRPYAATMPFISVLPVLGLTAIAQAMQWHKLLQVSQPQKQRSLLWIFGLSLALLTVGGPIATKMLSHRPQFDEISCPTGTPTVYFRYSAGSSINLVNDNVIRNTYIPNIRISDFKRMLDKYRERYSHRSKIPELTQELVNLSPHTTLMRKVNLKNGQRLWLIADSAIIPRKEMGIVGACGKTTSKWDPAIFYADSMTLVSR